MLVYKQASRYGKLIVVVSLLEVVGLFREQNSMATFQIRFSPAFFLISTTITQKKLITTVMALSSCSSWLFGGGNGSSRILFNLPTELTSLEQTKRKVKPTFIYFVDVRPFINESTSARRDFGLLGGGLNCGGFFVLKMNLDGIPNVMKTEFH